MLNNEDGIELARLLKARYKISKLWRFPISGGITRSTIILEAQTDHLARIASLKTVPCITLSLLDDAQSEKVNKNYDTLEVIWTKI